MAKETATIYDVAEKAGISIATVSRVLNNPQKVSSNTKNKIYNAMNELGFTPKAEARERAKKHVGKIGVITPYFTYPSFVHRLRGISDALKGTTFELVIITIEENSDIEFYLKSPGLKDRIDGFIILSHRFSDSSLKIIREKKYPVVFVEFGEDDFSSVCIDNLKGGEIVADYLVNKGYSTFAVLSENEKNIKVHPNELRVSGFINRLAEKKIMIPRERINYTSNELDCAISSAEYLLDRTDKPQVIFATTDLLAVAVIKASKRMNVLIPDQLAVIGFDGTNTSEYLDLTTVDQSLEESGKLAVELLMKRINSPEDPVQTIYLPLKIIERDTVTSL